MWKWIEIQEVLRETELNVSEMRRNLHLYFNFDEEFYVEFYSEAGYNGVVKELIDMPNIKPISDLRNYGDVLRDVSVGSPVFLTKNGRGRYAIIDIHDYEKTRATLKLMDELAKGRKSGEEQGWMSLDDVENNLGIIYE